MENNRLTPLYFALLFVSSTIMISTVQLNVYSQPNMTSMNDTTMQQHAEHTLDNLIDSEHIPLIGQLANGDYVLLMDLTPFATSVEGHSHIALKIPCNQDGSPKVTIATGVVPNLKSLDIGNAISNGTLDGEDLILSLAGKSCLYHAELPHDTTDIVLINTSDELLNFDEAGYPSVTISVHATAIQHSGANQTGALSPR